jgi:MATE family multidrug resistance protein
MYVLAAGTFFCAVTAPINWLLIFKLRLGLDGSALAFVALEAIYCMCLIGMCVLHNWRRPPAERWWGGWNRDALRGWGPFLRLSAAATAMVICDWWLYDLLTLLAGVCGCCLRAHLRACVQRRLLGQHCVCVQQC